MHQDIQNNSVCRLHTLEGRAPVVELEIRAIRDELDEISKHNAEEELQRLHQQIRSARHEHSEVDIRRAMFEHRELSPRRQTLALPLSEDLPIFLMRIFVEACAQLIDQRQLLATDAHSREDTYTAFMLALIQQRVVALGWSAEEQNHGGVPGKSGPERGRRDLVIKKGADAPFTIAEALRASSMATTTGASVDDHLRRLISRYDQVGAESLFMIVYAEVSDFAGFVERYKAHLMTANIPDSSVEKGPHTLKVWEDSDFVRRSISPIRTDHIVKGAHVPVCHIVIHLPPK